MASERQPWLKYYPRDVRGDAQLRGCSLAARGLWRDCLDLMHDATPRGYLRVGQEPLTVATLALHVSRPVKEVAKALAELEAAGIPARTESGEIYSRRMVRDTARAETLTENGRKGGSPVLVNQGLNQADNQDSEVLVKPKDKSARGTRALASGICVSERSSGSLSAARFDRFWEAYPRHEKRKDAARAFARLNPDHELLAVMLDAIARWKVTRRWREGFVPHPAAWLNGERWRDEIPAELEMTGTNVEPFRPAIPKASDVFKAQGL